MAKEKPEEVQSATDTQPADTVPTAEVTTPASDAPVAADASTPPLGEPTPTLSDKVDAAIEKTIDGAEALIEKAADAAGNAVEAVAGAVKGAIGALAGRVEVELQDTKAGTHTIFHSRGFTDFVDGKAVVLREIADELRQFGQVKGAE